MIQADPAGRFVLAPDLGLDRIFVWAFDATVGRLTAGDPPSAALPAGDGPRHFAFHPSRPWLFSIQEEGSTIVLFDYDASRGRLSARQTISSLPRGYAGSNFCSGIVVSGDGRFLYAGNRLHDSIGIFSIGSDGTLSWLDDVWTRGDYPRSMSIAPGGRFLYVCNQRADHVTTFRIDPRERAFDLHRSVHAGRQSLGHRVARHLARRLTVPRRRHRYSSPGGSAANSRATPRAFHIS